MNHKLLTSILVSTATFLACGTPRPSTAGSFSYELPPFTVKLRAPNFEYVRFSVEGTAHMADVKEAAAEQKVLGLVNRALAELYANVPSNGGSYALVNVVTDITSTTLHYGSTNSGQEQAIQRIPETLVIRADVVRFNPVNMETASAGIEPVPGVYPMTEEGQALLAAYVVDRATL